MPSQNARGNYSQVCLPSNKFCNNFFIKILFSIRFCRFCSIGSCSRGCWTGNPADCSCRCRINGRWERAAGWQEDLCEKCVVTSDKKPTPELFQQIWKGRWDWEKILKTKNKIYREFLPQVHSCHIPMDKSRRETIYAIIPKHPRKWHGTCVITFKWVIVRFKNLKKKKFEKDQLHISIFRSNQSAVKARNALPDELIFYGQQMGVGPVRTIFFIK